MAAAMPEAEQAKRQEQQGQEDHVTGGDKEDEGGDRQSNRQCPNHPAVGDGRPSPTVVLGLGVTTPSESRVCAVLGLGEVAAVGPVRVTAAGLR